MGPLFGWTIWGDNVQECGRGTSGEFARPPPCVSLETEVRNAQSDWGSAVEMGERRPLTEGVLVLEFGAHCDLRGGGIKFEVTAGDVGLRV